ncbi:BA14K family protein [Hoeflea olei]|uniref:Lectin-like protein BA14k n=1 Tax=Hoeflea olei TaxID=1480615 RepID=A0A1C1YUS0_9HYPH|nr:BA14K family protein [Hoeflea olei]OCW57100.1 hypothetical protein AWJ14_08100 [Hoeflea olei]
MLNTMMKTIFSASLCLAMLVPAGAAPMVVQQPAAEINNQVVQVQGREWRRGHNPKYRNYYRDDRRGFYRHNNRHYYNGHRGYRDRRPGYRRYNGYWFPPAAFALGAIVGGAIQNNNSGVRPGYTNPQHVSWCYDRYRSYRAGDNTYQPYNGPRRQCRSPYY